MYSHAVGITVKVILYLGDMVVEHVDPKQVSMVAFETTAGGLHIKARGTMYRPTNKNDSNNGNNSCRTVCATYVPMTNTKSHRIVRSVASRPSQR